MLAIILYDSNSILKPESRKNNGKLLSRWKKAETDASNGKREDS